MHGVSADGLDPKDYPTPTFADRDPARLAADGFNVYTTDLGEEGIDLGKIYDYDIVLLDLNLPNMSGFEVWPARRSKGHAQSVIHTGDLIVNRDTKTVEVSGARVYLTGKEYKILEMDEILDAEYKVVEIAPSNSYLW